MNTPKKLIGEYLIAAHLVTPDQLDRALKIQAESVHDGGRMPLIGTTLVQMGVLNEHDLAFALADQERDRLRIIA
jgi:hypothetical protein